LIGYRQTSRIISRRIDTIAGRQLLNSLAFETGVLAEGLLGE